MSESAPRISDEAVEFWAKQLYAECPYLGPWDQIGDKWQGTFREKATDDLTAILPLLCGGLEEERNFARQDAQIEREHAVLERVDRQDAERKLNQVREEVEKQVERCSPPTTENTAGAVRWRVEGDLKLEVLRPIKAILDSSSPLSGAALSAPQEEGEGERKLIREDGEALTKIADRIVANSPRLNGYLRRQLKADADLLRRLAKGSGS